MADSRHGSGFAWYTARMRGIIPLNDFRVSKNVLRLIRKKNYEIRIDYAFRAVMEHCAERESTWISDLIIDSYDYLHKMGFAHSVEVWSLSEELLGGLYGVAVGGAFFGESMFKTKPECDKIALYYCHQQLVRQDFELWDTQFFTPHLAQFGCIEISEDDYKSKLESAITRKTSFHE